MARIEICGAMGSGKTTLAELLAAHGLTPCLERVANNPFLADFYQNPAAHAFTKNSFFLLEHLHHCRNLPPGKIAVFDNALILHKAYASLNQQSAAEAAQYQSLYDFTVSQCGAPDLLIILGCDPELQRARINARGRDMENAIPNTYLAALNTAIQQEVAALPISQRVLYIDSGHYDLVHNKADQQAVITQIIAALRGADPSPPAPRP